MNLKVVAEIRMREEKLHEYISISKEQLKKLPEESLRLASSNGKPHYYIVSKPKERGKYISLTDNITPRNLAQADYLRSVIKAASEELRAVEGILKHYERGTLEDIAGNLHPARKSLVVPVYPSDEEAIAAFLNESYEKMGFAPGAPEFYTTDNERMRSKSEVIIAEHLKKYAIPYQYEYPVWLNDFRIVRPDFRVLNVRTREIFLWEHLGMMDDPEYAETNIKKIEDYGSAGYYQGRKLILTYETRGVPLNSKLVDSIIEQFLL